MVGCVLMLYKKLHLYRDNQNKAVWLDRGKVRRIEGAVTLIVGLGDIGGRFAQKMKSLGAYTIGIKRTEADKPGYIDELYTAEALDLMLPRADIVALTLPGTDATRNIMSRKRLFSMKEGATLLNIGRGSAVDTMALCDALSSGRLYAAALDVTDPEPLPSGHPLWKAENALITPHISGFFHLRDTYDNIIDIFVNNMERFHAGLPLLNIVDFSTGYRKTNNKYDIRAIR
jgi:phosphoglycerate dehydrogenase-like enzyme